jgi:hypothetical protein
MCINAHILFDKEMKGRIGEELDEHGGSNECPTMA